MSENFDAELIKELEKAPSTALFSHVSPDGDCVGSMLAIGLALERLGKEVFYYNPDSIPANLRFLPGVDKIMTRLPEHWPETCLFIDCADMQRVNLTPSDLPKNLLILNLDHHISNLLYGKFNWVDAQASATGEIAYQLISKLGIEIDKTIAANLYTAIMTDTGSFQYPNTTAETHRIVAELMEKGIDLFDINHHVYGQKPFNQVQLLKRALATLELSCQGQLGLMILTHRDFIECEADESLSEGFVNHARTICGVEVAILLKEVEDQRVKVGLRSNTWFNVNEAAAVFGGGGHARAAGCTIQGSVEEAKRLITQTIEEALRLERNHQC